MNKKIVIDTNVYLSGLFFDGIVKKTLYKLISFGFYFFVNNEILIEYKETEEIFLKKKYIIDSNLKELLSEKIVVFDHIFRCDICRDPDDNKFLDCAIDANASVLVSGDKDLTDDINVNNFAKEHNFEILKIKEISLKLRKEK